MNSVDCQWCGIWCQLVSMVWIDVNVVEYGFDGVMVWMVWNGVHVGVEWCRYSIIDSVDGVCAPDGADDVCT